MKPYRLALVHERFTEVAGSEKVVAELQAEWPDAAVYAPIATEDGTPPPIRSVRTSWLSSAYRLTGERSYAPLLPFVPRAARHPDIPPDTDAMIVSHHAFAAQAAIRSRVPVIAYVHSPARWAWEPEFRKSEATGAASSAALAYLSLVARRGERRAAPRIHRIVANSSAVAERISEFWGRESTVVHPPVDISTFTPDPAVPREDFFLVAGRLVAYKQPDIAIRAAQASGSRLVIAGDGRFITECKRIAGPETTFLGRVDDATLVDLHRRCRALVMPGVEDFGIVPVESMACGAPVLARNVGGALDSVIDGTTGMLVGGSDTESLIDGFAQAMAAMRDASFDSARIRSHAEQFSPAMFRSRMRAVVEESLLDPA